MSKGKRKNLKCCASAQEAKKVRQAKEAKEVREAREAQARQGNQCKEEAWKMPFVLIWASLVFVGPTRLLFLH